MFKPVLGHCNGHDWLIVCDSLSAYWAWGLTEEVKHETKSRFS